MSLRSELVSKESQSSLSMERYLSCSLITCSHLASSSDFDMTVNTIDAKLLYFLDVDMNEALIEFGAGVFVDIDKERALRITEDDPNSVRYGRVTRDMLPKIPVKSDLFQICAAAAAGEPVLTPLFPSLLYIFYNSYRYCQIYPSL